MPQGALFTFRRDLEKVSSATAKLAVVAGGAGGTGLAVVHAFAETVQY